MQYKMLQILQTESYLQRKKTDCYGNLCVTHLFFTFNFMVFQHKYIENEVCFYVEQLRAKNKDKTMNSRLVVINKGRLKERKYLEIVKNLA